MWERLWVHVCSGVDPVITIICLINSPGALTKNILLHESLYNIVRVHASMRAIYGARMSAIMSVHIFHSRHVKSYIFVHCTQVEQTFKSHLEL